jgi:hypothetical protein
LHGRYYAIFQVNLRKSAGTSVNGAGWPLTPAGRIPSDTATNVAQFTNNRSWRFDNRHPMLFRFQRFLPNAAGLIYRSGCLGINQFTPLPV